MKSTHLGVVVVRLQVPSLHDGHRYLLNAVTAIHDKVLVVIGESEARGTLKDPLPFSVREAMVKAEYPNVKVMSLRDRASDQMWSNDLDWLIWGQCPNQPIREGAMLYGGRDSFLKHYLGCYPTFELPPAMPMSGTEIRDAVCQRDSEDFRAGMIFAAKNRYPTSYQCVDVAILDGQRRVLVGQKKSDEGKWRFIGGFVSVDDPSLERAALREVREETGIEPGDMIYIGSVQVDDYRYPKSGRDRLMSAFFITKHIFGAAKAADDIDACKWMSVEDLTTTIVPQHIGLLEMLDKYLADEIVKQRKDHPDAH